MSDCLNNEEQIKSNLSENNSDNLTSNLDGNVEISSTIDKTNNVTSQMNTLNETSSNLVSEEPLKSKLDFPVTGLYSGSQGDNINVEVDNQGFIIRASLKQIKFNSVADFPTIGSERLIYIDATNKAIYGWDSASQLYYKLSSGGSGGNAPTKTSQLENDGDGTSPFSTKNYVDNLVVTIPKFGIEVVDNLPTENISTTTIYLLRNTDGENLNNFVEYIYANNGWEILGELQQFDLTNYPTMQDWYELVDNKRVMKNTEGGFKGGASNTTPDEDVGSGGAIGNLAKAETGFAGGSQSVSWSGGAVGSGSFAGKGFAGGYNAKAYGQNGELSDSIQLGTGYNSNEKTMQVYDDNIYDANTHTLTVKNIELDGEDIKDLMGGSGEYLPLAGGTMAGEIAIGQGDGKGIQLGKNGRINGTTDDGSTTATVLGLNDDENSAIVGHSSFSLAFRGSATRPTYNNKDMALYSDVINLGRFVNVASTSGTRYYPLVRFNKAVSDGYNYSGLFLNGRIGGWGYDNMAYINAFFWGRDKRGGEYNSLGNIKGALARADFVMYEESSTSVVLYLKINGYALARFSFSGSGDGIANLYDGSYITSTPTGTLIASMTNGTISEKKDAELLYDMSSSSSSINWGKTSGIKAGEKVSGKDFSKYSFLRVTAASYDIKVTYFVDLKKVVPVANNSSYPYVGSVSSLGSKEMTEIHYSLSVVNTAKTEFYYASAGYLKGSTWNVRKDNSNYYVSKVEGVI